MKILLEEDVELKLLDASTKLNRSVGTIVNSILRSIELVDIEETIEVMPRERPPAGEIQRKVKVIRGSGN